MEDFERGGIGHAVGQLLQQASDQYGLTGETFLLQGVTTVSRTDCSGLDVQLRCDFVAHLTDLRMHKATEMAQIGKAQGIASLRIKRRIWRSIKNWLLHRKHTFFVVSPSKQEYCIMLSPPRNNIALFIDSEQEESLAMDVLAAMDDALINIVRVFEKGARGAITRSARQL